MFSAPCRRQSLFRSKSLPITPVKKLLLFIGDLFYFHFLVVMSFNNYSSSSKSIPSVSFPSRPIETGSAIDLGISSPGERFFSLWPFYLLCHWKYKSVVDVLLPKLWTEIWSGVESVSEFDVSPARTFIVINTSFYTSALTKLHSAAGLCARVLKSCRRLIHNAIYN